MQNINELIGKHDILFVTLDTLRYDVAQECWAKGRTPNLASVLPTTGWEKRHSPATFTYAAHHAFFAGFLPTPEAPGRHPRLFATRFAGSETTTESTCVLDAPDIVTGLAEHDYHTVCIGGVGFFNKLNPLGRVLPCLFEESHWSEELGVTNQQSTANQVVVAQRILEALPAHQRVFLFLNISAIHQPNRFYLDGAVKDSLLSHTAALEYVDAHLGSLFRIMQKRAPILGIICSDHGTAYGEDNYHGHRLAHPVVWEVPYADFVLPKVNPLGHHEH
ncbi:STM4013/SEN3800 family hydrolase [Pedosphaera parvula]|uniref:Sulfatase N-terminal domain-containing protein n=1 Tax=Pedosphaera parvula (strain Ellin514) TaxID=320771 RepID=B9XL17_PEDPL|nr:STM4013/SEN3800 family hydrolase [Pedosphaera parvula]EEF59511.1 conserved hypothetical protein [Pedosphaera parvula Ellin514]